MKREEAEETFICLVGLYKSRERISYGWFTFFGGGTWIGSEG